MQLLVEFAAPGIPAAKERWLRVPSAHLKRPNVAAFQPSLTGRGFILKPTLR
jgi:hypothetical protein